MRRNSFRVIWFFFKFYKPYLLALLALSLVVGALEAINVAAVYPILTVAFDIESAQGNVIFSLLSSAANLLPIADEFIAYAILFLIIAIVAFIAKLISIRFRVRFGAHIVEKNQNDIFNKFIRADYQYYLDHKQGELLYNVASAPQSLANLVNSVTELISQGVLSISVLVLLVTLSWQGTIAVILVGLIYYYFTKNLGGKVSYHSSKGEMEAVRASNVVLNEVISGIKQVKVFATGEDWINRFKRITKERWQYHIKRSIWQQIPAPVLMLTLYLSIGLIAVLIKLIAPTSFVGLIPVFGTFTFAVFRLFPILGATGALIMQVMGALPNCEVVYSIRNDTLTHIEDGEKEISSFKSGIQFDNISFTYKQRAEILGDISITFKKGETTAVVGRSGVGKTTIINLLLRLFDPSKGEIKVDGVNLKEYKLSSWLDKIGFVSQDTFIFNDTIKNNVTFYASEYSDEEVFKAARYAAAHNFITELPEGYDTLVGDKGIKLSSGQGQRIAVARAMIREPEILIFDEATNALDNISELAVQKAIDKISKDHTVIIIAHRLSTIVGADKIIVLGDGRVLEEGTHEELLGEKGAYWELYRSQPM